MNAAAPPFGGAVSFQSSLRRVSFLVPRKALPTEAHASSTYPVPRRRGRRRGDRRLREQEGRTGRRCRPRRSRAATSPFAFKPPVRSNRSIRSTSSPRPRVRSPICRSKSGRSSRRSKRSSRSIHATSRIEFNQAVADDVVSYTTLQKTIKDQAPQDSLFARHVITASEHDSSQSTLTAAQADLVNSRAALDLARQALEDATVEAPLGGTIVSRPVTQGTIITSATSANGGTTLDDDRRPRPRPHARHDRRSRDGERPRRMNRRPSPSTRSPTMSSMASSRRSSPRRS